MKPRLLQMILTISSLSLGWGIGEAIQGRPNVAVIFVAVALAIFMVRTLLAEEL